MARIQQPKCLISVRKFLAKHHMRGTPILVGLSGGPDSRALLCALHALRSEHQAVLHVIHVDHRWRSQSGWEASELEKWTGEFDGVVFHLHRVDVVMRSEEGARKQRLAIFEQSCLQLGCQAVMLGHHSDDQAETVFKRLCDGASLPKLAGLRAVHRIRELTIWRPLLACTKEEIAEWLKELGVMAFADPTNGSEYCLRGRLRETVFPVIRHHVGGQPAFAMIGADAASLEEFLDELTTPIFKQVVRGPWGVWLDACEALSWHRFLQTALVRRFCELEGLTLSREGVRVAQEILAKGGVGQVERGGKILYIDRGRLFLPVEPSWWHQHESKECVGGWQALWRGFSSCLVPRQAYTLVLPSSGMCYPGTRSLGRWYNMHRVPRFLRRSVPVVIQQGQVVGEFLSGHGGSKNMGVTDMISIGVGATPGLSGP